MSCIKYFDEKSLEILNSGFEYCPNECHNRGIMNNNFPFVIMTARNLKSESIGLN